MKNAYNIDSFIAHINAKYPTTVLPVIEKMSQEERESQTILQLTEIVFPDIALICNNRFETQKLAIKLKLDFEFSTQGKTTLLTKEYAAIYSYLTTTFALWFLGYADLTILLLIDRIKFFESVQTDLGEFMFWDIMNSYRNGEFLGCDSQIEEAFTKGLKDYKIEFGDNPNEDLVKLWQKIEPNLPYSLPKFILKLNKQREYLKFLKIELSKLVEVQQPVNVKKESTDKLSWKGNNETEFVQFAYGLFHSGILKDESEQITKFVPKLAEVFNLKLGKNWLSNHNKSVKKRNLDYRTEIFDKIKEGYDRYTSQ